MLKTDEEFGGGVKRTDVVMNDKRESFVSSLITTVTRHDHAHSTRRSGRIKL